MPSDLDALLGGTPTPVAPTAEANEALRQQLATKRAVKGKKGVTFEKPELISSEPMPHETEFLRPVGITFLASIMKRQPRQIVKRLARCPVVGHHNNASGQQPLYDFMTAMSFLVPPKGNIEEWFGQQNAASLPPYVNKMWWDSAHQRNRVMRSSGDLWHTEDVTVVLGRVVMTIAQETKLWIEGLPGREHLSDKQYNALVDGVNGLVNGVRDAVAEGLRDHTTRSMAHTIAEELESAGGSGAKDDAVVVEE